MPNPGLPWGANLLKRKIFHKSPYTSPRGPRTLAKPRPRSNILRHRERLTIVPREKAVGLVIADDHLGMGVNNQFAAQLVFRLLEIHFVFLEILLHASQGLVGILVVAEGLGRWVERHLLTQPIGGVGEVDQRRGVVSLQ